MILSDNSIFHVEKINSTNSKYYRHLISSKMRSMIDNIDIINEAIFLGISIFAKPIGLIYGRIYPEDYDGKIHSLYVIPKFRNRGAATLLLNEIEKYFIEQKTYILNMFYLKKTDMYKLPIERVLEKCSWEKPKMTSIQYTSDKDIVNASWIKLAKLPSSFEYFLWKDLTDKEANELKSKKYFDYPPYLSPFLPDGKYEPVNSIGLRYKGKIAGWMITQRLSEDTILYSRLFVINELQKMGRAISLIAQSIKYSFQNNIFHGVYSHLINNEGMKQFIEKHMKDYLLDISGGYTAIKKIK